MFTTGSKLFIGASTLAIAGALIYGITQDDSALGVIGLASAAAALLFLMGINFWVRDCNVSSMDTAAIETSSSAQRAPGRSLWPVVGGIGVATVPVGLVVGRALVWVSVLLILIAAVEWLVQSWSERASGDPEYNESVRKRILHPIELPLLAAIGLGLIIFSFSRIMLWLPSTSGAIVFGVIAAGVLAFGALIATNRNVATSLVVVLCSLGAVGIIGAGVATAVSGGRHIEEHEVPSYEEGTCGEAVTEADEHSSEVVSAKSNLSAIVILEDGELRAEVVGVNEPLTTLQLPRSLDSFIQFKNLDEGEFRLVVDLGVEVIDPEADPPIVQEEIYCTQAVEEGGSQFIIVNPSRPSFSAEDPFTLTVPGVDGFIAIEVP